MSEIRSPTVWQCLTGKSHSRVMGGLLLTLVLLLHLWVGLWLLQPSEPVTKIKPVMIEVALLAAPVQQAKPAQVQETKAPPTPKQAPEKPKKRPAKIPVKKITPLISKPKERPKPQPVIEAISPMPDFPAFEPSVSETPAKVVAKAVAPSGKAAPSAVPVAGKDEPITCIHCPKPEFPAIAQRRNWQGTVKLKLQFSADGSVEQVTILASSGHELLDEKAVKDVKKWRFVPGKPGRFATQTINFKFDN